MASMFRSEEMTLCQLFIPSEAKYKIIASLGERGMVQFRDINPKENAIQRKFVSEVHRCDEMERQLRYIKSELEINGIKMSALAVLPPAPNPETVINLEAHINYIYNDILETAKNAIELNTNHVKLKELKQYFEKALMFFAGTENFSESRSLISSNTLCYVGGVIARERLPGFERMLWRVSHGTVLLRTADIDIVILDPVTGDRMNKTIFVAFYQGCQLESLIKKVCFGFKASIYTIPRDMQERKDFYFGLQTRLTDLNTVLSYTNDHRRRLLDKAAKDLPNWMVMVRKVKAIYHTLNLCNINVSEKCLIGEGWVPTKDLPVVRTALAEGSDAAGSPLKAILNIIQTNQNPPTFNRTNKFTKAFQNLIDAYGIASYREANPALYTIITFPFLFAVMFGDIGHGMIMTLFAAWLILWEKSLATRKGGGDVWNIFFGGRYIILLMGLFSMYTGFVYNDIFSKSMNIFGSSWRINYNSSTFIENRVLQLNPSTRDLTDIVYPIGLDPVWQLAVNKIIFLNSYKMKLSIIFGVCHMIFGVIMSTVNMVNFRRKVSILLEFLPQILFLVLLFAYLITMMFMKWVLYGPKMEDIRYSPGCAPSVLIMFINMMLAFFKKTKTPSEGCHEFMFDSQKNLQIAFLFIALVCIKWMLLGKPLFIAISRALSRYRRLDEVPMSEIIIHQSIHTVEYVLSTISHTASYLRLWALSLAHAQLSEVLWNMVMRLGLKSQSMGSIKLYIFFAFWAILTLAILVLMEGLSAFLHTLRLHWVEFMSKFYEGLGYTFQPFSFQTILQEIEEETK